MFRVKNTLLINRTGFYRMFKRQFPGIFYHFIQSLMRIYGVIGKMQPTIKLWELQIIPIFLRIPTVVWQHRGIRRILKRKMAVTLK